MNSFRKSQRGFTFVELAIVLGIVGLIIAGIWVAAASVSRKNKETKAAQQLSEIVQNVRSLYSAQVDTTGITTESMIFSGAIPAEMKKSDTEAINPWGGNVMVEVATAQRIYISYFGVPQASCINLLMTTTVNPTEIGMVLSSAGAVPVDNARATTACPNATALGNNVRWVFNVHN